MTTPNNQNGYPRDLFKASNLYWTEDWFTTVDVDRKKQTKYNMTMKFFFQYDVYY